ncbi:MAG: hypothetical protein IT181_12225 [Acidobacteria bacterium]|nr:hypothetical protein [Acidobacteriota bacterium]
MIAIDSLVTAFGSGRLTRRQLVQGLAALVAGSGAATAVAQAPPIPARSRNHVSLAVADPEASKQFFQKTFGMPNPGRVDHVCFGVDSYDVNQMAAKPESQGIRATIRKDEPEVYFTDPDGIRFQLENKGYRG